MSEPVLDVSGLRVAFRSRRSSVTALRDVAFTLHAGRTLALVGESGSGKSVSSLAIMGLLPKNGSVSGGSIRYRRSGGQTVDLARAPESELRALRGAEIAMIFQEPMSSLNPLFTIGDQIGEMLLLHSDLDAAARRKRVLEMLDMVGLPRRVAGVALIDIGQRHGLPRGLLHGDGQLGNLLPVLGIGRGDMDRQQVPQGIDGQVDFGALFPFGTIPPRASTAFRGALQGAAVQNHRTRLGGSSLADADQHPQIGNDRFEDAGRQPTTRLLVDRLPGWQIVGHIAPLESGAGNEAQSIEELAQGMNALRGILAHEGEVGGQKSPFLIGNIGVVGGTGRGVHSAMLPHPKSA